MKCLRQFLVEAFGCFGPMRSPPAFADEELRLSSGAMTTFIARECARADPRARHPCRPRCSYGHARSWRRGQPVPRPSSRPPPRATRASALFRPEDRSTRRRRCGLPSLEREKQPWLKGSRGHAAPDLLVRVRRPAHARDRRAGELLLIAVAL